MVVANEQVEAYLSLFEEPRKESRGNDPAWLEGLRQAAIERFGELGFPTRVLSPVFGGIFTYAAPMYTAGTAAGQVGSRFLRNLYRVDKLCKTAKIYGVIGSLEIYEPGSAFERHL